jgi:hypothetical protein
MVPSKEEMWGHLKIIFGSPFEAFFKNFLGVNSPDR